MTTWNVLIGDAIEQLRTLPEQSVQTCITSPPYWGLRSYLPDDDPAKAHELGAEPTPDEYVANMVAVFREVWRVLRDDGTLWLNLGDSYTSTTKGSGGPSEKQASNAGSRYKMTQRLMPDTKPKDLVGIPWRVAFALQADGWYLRSDIIWHKCLSGGTWVYARTQKGDMPMTIKDLYRLDPSTVQLWNGKQWTQLHSMEKNGRSGDELELVLRSGERISCTPTHRFPTNRGIVDAGNLSVGDVIESCQLPEPDQLRDCAIDEDAAWLAGLYIAEGSMSGSAIQIAGHAKEQARWERLKVIAKKFGGSITRTVDGNKQDIRIYGRILHAIIDELVSGRTSKDKGFSPVVWRYSNKFIAAMVDGYLSGDGHFDASNNRWRLGFTRNYNLERDLRTACARLGYHLTLNLSTTKYDGRMVPTFRGELRKTRNGHWNEADKCEIVEIRKARCRYVYDIAVNDDPHLFALASGVLTHNSNPMPESVTDRPTKAHEYLFLLTKSARYYYDAEAIKEPTTGQTGAAANFQRETKEIGVPGQGYLQHRNGRTPTEDNGTRNKRSVWTVSTKPYSGSHYAVFPPDLIEPCILAGTSARGQCPDCGAPWERVVKRTPMEVAPGPSRDERSENGRLRTQVNGTMVSPPTSQTVGWRPTCDCRSGPIAAPVPQTVLDPFVGSGTTLQVAIKHNRNAIGIDLDARNAELINERMSAIQPVLIAV